jgi:hypothetical protein
VAADVVEVSESTDSVGDGGAVSVSVAVAVAVAVAVSVAVSVAVTGVRSGGSLVCSGLASAVSVSRVRSGREGLASLVVLVAVGDGTSTDRDGEGLGVSALPPPPPPHPVSRTTSRTQHAADRAVRLSISDPLSGLPGSMVGA